ncbi:hypothetical protein [Roseovarius sp. MMSF_3281]|uniref:hypothetical protein n=1 Tax=Roseovarius sp. MMSF_3281 TaxID=3046694 RepID=UPI00273ED856|nr:hypothetical protein [Roseovarius sp. MMSF_3281]
MTVPNPKIAAALVPARCEFGPETQCTLSFGPVAAPDFHDQVLPRHALKVAHFRSMRISHDIYTKAPKEAPVAMAKTYRDGGAPYMPVEEPGE